MTEIKRLVLDVLKPHDPSIIELAEKLGSIPGISGVNCMLDEVDRETDSLKLVIEGSNIDYQKVLSGLEECGAVVHSIDSVSAGKKIVEDVETPQDR